MDRNITESAPNKQESQSSVNNNQIEQNQSILNTNEQRNDVPHISNNVQTGHNEQESQVDDMSEKQLLGTLLQFYQNIRKPSQQQISKIEKQFIQCQKKVLKVVECRKQMQNSIQINQLKSSHHNQLYEVLCKFNNYQNTINDLVALCQQKQSAVLQLQMQAIKESKSKAQSETSKSKLKRVGKLTQNIKQMKNSFELMLQQLRKTTINKQQTEEINAIEKASRLKQSNNIKQSIRNKQISLEHKEKYVRLRGQLFRQEQTYNRKYKQSMRQCIKVYEQLIVRKRVEEQNKLKTNRNKSIIIQIQELEYLNNLKSNVQLYEKELLRLKEVSDAKEKELQYLKQVIALRQQELLRVKQVSDRNSKQVTNLKEQLTQQQQQLTNKSSSLVQQEHISNQKEAKIRTYQSKIQQLQNELQKQRKKYKKDMGLKQKDLSNMQRQLSQKQKIMNHKLQQLKAISQKLSELESGSLKIFQESSKSKAQMEKYKKELEMYRNLCRQLQTQKVQYMQAQIESKIKEEQKEKLYNEQRSNQKLVQSQLRQENRKQKQQICELQIQVRQANNRISQCQAHMDRLQNIVQSRNMQIQELKQASFLMSQTKQLQQNDYVSQNVSHPVNKQNVFAQTQNYTDPTQIEPINQNSNNISQHQQMRSSGQMLTAAQIRQVPYSDQMQEHQQLKKRLEESEGRLVQSSKAYQQKIEQYKRKIVGYQQELLHNQGIYKQKAENLQQQIRERQNRILQKQEQMQVSQQQILEKDRNIKQLDQQICTLQTELSRQIEHLEKTYRQNQWHSSRCRQMQQNIFRKEQYIKILEQKQKELQNELISMHDKVETLQMQLAQSRSITRNYRKEQGGEDGNQGKQMNIQELKRYIQAEIDDQWKQNNRQFQNIVLEIYQLLEPKLQCDMRDQQQHGDGHEGISQNHNIISTVCQQQLNINSQSKQIEQASIQEGLHPQNIKIHDQIILINQHNNNVLSSQNPNIEGQQSDHHSHEQIS